MAKGGYRGGQMGGMNMNMIKQAQKMQQDMMKMQQEMETRNMRRLPAAASSRRPSTGKHELTASPSSPRLSIPRRRGNAAGHGDGSVNEAMRKAEADSAASMSKLTGGMGLNGLF
jgi:hypothetical protein